MRLNATDADLGENARITYSLITDTNDFRIDPETGVLFISSPLDRERQDLYELQVRAADNGPKNEQPQLSSDALVRVIVEDVSQSLWFMQNFHWSLIVWILKRFFLNLFQIAR